MEIQSAEEKLNQVLAEGTSKEDVSAGLDRIVAEASTRILKAIDSGVRDLDRATQQRTERIECYWQPLVDRIAQPIVSSKSATPGLSHHDLYTKEIQGAIDQASSLDDFMTRMEVLIKKWGSMTKYPLFAKGRRKQLEQLSKDVRTAAPKESKKAKERAEKLARPELQKIREEAKENIGFGATDFHELLSAALRRPNSPDYLIHLRWLLIQLLQNHLFHKLYSWLDEGHREHRELLYFAFEKHLNKMYQSFQVYVSQVARKAAAGEKGSADLSVITEMELQRTNRMIASLETTLSTLKLSPPIAAIIKARLRQGDFDAATDPQVFVEIGSGIRSDFGFDQFVDHLKRIDGLDIQSREEIIAALKTEVEPFRSLYYAKINFVRYSKGLKTLRESV